jgi:hypothetical protein
VGYATAVGLTDTDLTLSDQIGIHFATNCYPPIPKVMIPVAVAAIDAYWEEDYSRLIELPFDGVDRNGEPFQIRWRDGSTSVSASQAIESLRLDAWCVDDYEDED